MGFESKLIHGVSKLQLCVAEVFLPNSCLGDSSLFPSSWVSLRASSFSPSSWNPIDSLLKEQRGGEGAPQFVSSCIAPYILGRQDQLEREKSFPLSVLG